MCLLFQHAICWVKIPNGSCIIEGDNHKICGKAIYLVFSEANQIPELERRTHCPLHASSTKTKEKIDTTTKEECKSASITDSFIPDYVDIVPSMTVTILIILFMNCNKENNQS